MKQTPQQQNCPLCHAPNQCAITKGLPAEQCWCMNSNISKAALDSIPEQDKGLRCICPSCANTIDKDTV